MTTGIIVGSGIIQFDGAPDSTIRLFPIDELSKISKIGISEAARAIHLQEIEIIDVDRAGSVLGESGAGLFFLPRERNGKVFKYYFY